MYQAKNCVNIILPTYTCVASKYTAHVIKGSICVVLTDKFYPALYWPYFVLLCLTLYRAKHPVKVHVWRGISRCGRTDILDGTMDAPLYIQILEQALLPFLKEVYPDGHRSWLIMTQNTLQMQQRNF